MAFEMERAALVDFLQELVKRKDGKPTDKAFSNIEAAVEYSGTKIVLPADPRHMAWPKHASGWPGFEKSQEEVIAIHEVIDAHPDGCVAFMQAMKETYGWAQPAPARSFFGRSPPQMIRSRPASTRRQRSSGAASGCPVSMACWRPVPSASVGRSSSASRAMSCANRPR